MDIRSDYLDYVVAYHEAAHAVTAEILRPGGVLLVDMDVKKDGVEAHVLYDWWDADLALLAMIAAGREGQLLVDDGPREWLWKGDNFQLAFNGGNRWRVYRARQKAKALVAHHVESIDLLAKALMRYRLMDGIAIRELLKENAPFGAYPLTLLGCEFRTGDLLQSNEWSYVYRPEGAAECVFERLAA